MSGALYIPPVMCLRLLVHHLRKGRCSQPAVLGLRALCWDTALQKCSGIYLHPAAPCVLAPQLEEASRVMLLSAKEGFGLCFSVGERVVEISPEENILKLKMPENGT